MKIKLQKALFLQMEQCFFKLLLTEMTENAKIK